MQIGSRFTEYGLTGGFFWICQFILLWCSGQIQTLQPKTIPAASCELAAVQAAVNQAVDGDTVTIPECTARWTTELKVTKCITLQGQTTVANAGTKDATADDKTIIIDEVATALSIVQLNS